jgi:hypothetical protein
MIAQSPCCELSPFFSGGGDGFSQVQAVRTVMLTATNRRQQDDHCHLRNERSKSKHGLMNELNSLVTKLELGTPQVHGNLTVISLLRAGNGGVQYLDLSEPLGIGNHEATI